MCMNALDMESATGILAYARVLEILLFQIVQSPVENSAPKGWVKLVLATDFAPFMGFVAVQTQYRKRLVATEVIVVRTVLFQS